MRSIFSVLIFIVLLFSFSSRIEAQQTQTKLNQVELMKKFIGSWKMEVSKDTISFFEVVSLSNNRLEISSKTVCNGKIIYEGKSFQGYDKKSDTFIDIGADEDYPPAILFSSFWFSSENTCELSFNVDPSSNDKVTIKSKIEFKSPDLFIQTITQKNKVTRINTITRVVN